MKVYHGSYMTINEIDLTKCEINRDFGRGFYVTKLLEQAEFWAKRKGRPFGNDGVVTDFTFYDNAFDKYGLKVLRFEDYTEEWLDFVVLNRDPETPDPAHDYDIVEGPVANDDIAARIFVYLGGGISKDDFINELKFKHKPSHQIAFCTVRSLQMLKWKDNTSDVKMFSIDDAIINSLVEDYNLSEDKAIDLYFDSKTYNRLIDDASGLYQKPWQEVYRLLIKELKW